MVNPIATASPNALDFAASTFTCKTNSKATPIVLNRESLVYFLSNHEVRSTKDGRMFAPATFNGSRSNGNFISASCLCLDFDHGQPSIAQILELLPGMYAVYYSTYSHCWKNTEKTQNGVKIPADKTYTPGNPRFRVVIPLSRQVNALEHVRVVSGIRSILTSDLMECLDTTCFEISRSHFLPSCPPELESYTVSGFQDGELLDVEHFMSLACDSDQPITKHSHAAPVANKSLGLAPVVLQHTAGYKEPASGDRFDLPTWASKNPNFDIVGAVNLKYRRGDIQDGKQHIRCPFEAEHTDQSHDFATFIANASPPEYNSWDIHCCHEHCAGRDRLDFLSVMLEEDWISVDLLQVATPAAVAMRRPPKIYFPVNDILAASDWSSLNPPERRIALDLTIMAWASDDGTITDDDWQIARRLGLPEKDWLEFRGTLARTGWLIEIDGQMTNTIVKREFEKAQTAYMSAIIKASNGGKITQMKARANSQKKQPAEAPLQAGG